jgi:NAD(P)H dehydrogenase (quinone)
MTPINVLVIFCSRSGLTEKLALAAAVGAVQARANIRLRRLPVDDEESAESNEPLARMRREYVPPTPADAMWADAVIVGMNGKIAGLPAEAGDATAYGRKIAADAREFKHPDRNCFSR